MSHYAVAVFANSPDDFYKLLAPYNENGFQTRHVVDQQKLLEQYDRFLERNPGWRELGFDYYLREHGCRREGSEIVSYYNDNAKWDYYSLGGASYLYDLKPGEFYDTYGCARKNQYDYSNSEYDQEACASFWDRCVAGDDTSGMILSKEYYLERYGTKEQYLKECAFNGPYAFITPDGVWHSPGTVGWFASDDATAETKNQYIDEWQAYIASDDDPYVSFVDCHI